MYGIIAVLMGFGQAEPKGVEDALKSLIRVTKQATKG